LDQFVTFGRADALRQQAYGGPKAPAIGGTGLAAWKVALIATGAALLLGLGLLLLALLWRRQRRNASPVRTLDRALRSARERHEPLSLITLAAADEAEARQLSSSLR